MAIAEVRFTCGRYYLSVAELAVAMEGDKCRDGDFPEHVYDPIPQEELERASYGGMPCKDMPIKMVRHVRGDCWTEKMLRYAADTINAATTTPTNPRP